MSSHAPPAPIPAHVLQRANVTTLSRAVLKRDRWLPVTDTFAGALRAAGLASGLTRGSVYGVTGVAPTTLAALLLAEASRSGAWIAWCSAVAPNPRALFDAGWCLDRLVCIDPRNRWSACIGACVGEFEVVVAGVPQGVPPGEVRRMSTAVSRSNGIAVLLPNPTGRIAPVDVEFRVGRCRWGTEGGRLSSQSFDIVLGGRRVAEPHSFEGLLGAS